MSFLSSVISADRSTTKLAFIGNQLLIATAVAMSIHLLNHLMEFGAASLLGYQSLLFSHRVFYLQGNRWDIPSVAAIYGSSYLVFTLVLVLFFRLRHSLLFSNGIVGQLGFWLRYWTVMALIGGLAGDLIAGKGMAYLIRFAGFDYRFGWLGLLPLLVITALLIRPMWNALATVAISTKQLDEGLQRRYALLAGLLPATVVAVSLSALVSFHPYRTIGMLAVGVLLMAMITVAAPWQVLMMRHRYKLRTYQLAWPMAVVAASLATVMVVGHWKALPSKWFNGVDKSYTYSGQQGSVTGHNSRFTALP